MYSTAEKEKKRGAVLKLGDVKDALKIKRGRGRPRKVATDVIGAVEKTARQVGAKTKRGFKKNIQDTGVGKEIASRLIDVGADVLLPAGTTALSMALGDPTGLSGAVVGKMAGDEIQRQADKKGYGYGLKGKALKAKKDAMIDLFVKMGASQPHAKSLTNKVFKEGETVLDQDEVKIRGGKLSLKQVKKTLAQEAKQLWREARPVLKYAGEKALEYGEPLIEAGVKSVALYAGADPETADIASKTFTAGVKEKAQRGLRRVSKKKSKSPQEFIDEASARVQKRTTELVDELEKRNLKMIERSPMDDMSKELAKQKITEKANAVKADIDDRVEKVEAQAQNAVGVVERKGKKVADTLQDFTGGMGMYGRGDMSTLLSPDSIAKQSFYLQPNVQQGNIRGFAGSGLTAFGGRMCGSGSLYMDTMLGGSFRNYGGSFRL